MIFHNCVSLVTFFTNAMSSSNVLKYLHSDGSSSHENSKCEDEAFFTKHFLQSSGQVGVSRPRTFAVSVSCFFPRAPSVFVAQKFHMNLSGDNLRISSVPNVCFINSGTYTFGDIPLIVKLKRATIK